VRKHFIRAAAIAAPVLLIGGLAAGSASAATHSAPIAGATITTTNAAGYEASGRDFRFITSTLRVPDWPSSSGLFTLYPQSYIQLAEGSLNSLGGPSGDEYVRAGIEPCDLLAVFAGGSSCHSGDWVAFASVYNNSLNAPVWQHYTDLAGVNQGDGVNFSIYFDQPGNELHFAITPPVTSGPETFYKTQAFGPLFDHADAVDDWFSTTGQPVPVPPGFNKFRVNQFLQGALTTYSGARGSFVGPWTTSQVIATSNGLPVPSGTTRVSPNALYGDTLPANGAVRASDAFGVWTR
jgi:hypothetical protein